MRQDSRKIENIFLALGVIPILWIALLIAPYTNGGIINILKNLNDAISNPINIIWTNSSIKTIFIFLLIYAICVSLYLTTRKNYRKQEEHGSAKWGNCKAVNKKYMQYPESQNKILTQNVKLGLDGKKHRRNLNVMVVGGSGAGKTRFYCKPNILQCNTSFIALDPKGELLRDTGNLLKKKGYKVKVLDLVNMEKSDCYNPFKYLETENDVQRLITNIFKAKQNG